MSCRTIQWRAIQKGLYTPERMGNKIIAEFKLNVNERILDLGCGDGTLTAELAQLVPDGFVLGIDGSQNMIETARKLEKKNLSFRVQDITPCTIKMNLMSCFPTRHCIGLKTIDCY